MHLARKATRGRMRTAAARTDTLDHKRLFSVLSGYQGGDLAVRMPDDRTGLAGEICAALNANFERNEQLVKELELRIAERTRELASANSALTAEIEERTRIEQ